MKYLVKDQSGKLMHMVLATSGGLIASFPGIEILGLSSELNPEDKELDRLSWDGQAIVDDPDKILAARQAFANANLDEVRALREPLLLEADHEINALEDDGQSATALRAYRKALRECTDEYKKVNGDAKLLCENLVPEEFEFPVKP